MRGRIVAAVLLVVLSAAGAYAQPAANPVMDNYRAYQEALARGDLANAEVAAVAALAASEQRDGDGGRTAVLLLNLATLRLDRGNASGAKAPAERALALASRENGGVDPLLAEIVLGQVELATGSGIPGRDRLASVLARAENRPDLSDRRLVASNELGHWALARGDHAWARIGFGFAARSVTGADPLSTYLRARAHLAEAGTIIQGDQRTRRRDPAGAMEALRILVNVEDELRPHIQRMQADNAVTPTQQAFAESLAWQGVVRLSYPELTAPPNIATTDECEVKYDQSEFTHYLMNLYRVVRGVVVVRVLFDDEGRMQRTEVVVAEPQEYFPQNARQMAVNFNIRADRTTRPGCQMPRVHFFPVTFRVISNPQPDRTPANRRWREQGRQ